jgi:CheY-like chemotaxis protein
VRREPVDLAALVRDTVEQNRPLADRKNQTVTLDLPPSLVAQADPDRLREAVDNLVSNAIKYAPPGGTITVFAGERGGEAAIAVSDDGPGLSPEDRSRLFGRFQRLSAKPTGGESSTGLGLSICQAHRRPPRRLHPRRERGCRPRHHLRTSPCPATARNSMTKLPLIYVVDDEKSARDMVGRLPEDARLQRRRCCDGGAALRKALEADVPDLVVLDLNMPGGGRPLRPPRPQGQRLPIPVIMLTATASPIDRVVGLELGADDYHRQALRVARARRAHPLGAAPGGGGSAPGRRRGTDAHHRALRHQAARPRHAHACARRTAA